MPEISRFYGIVIGMYWEDHPRPHFHATYAEFEAKIEIGTGQVIRGHLPRRALRMVREWERMHREELTSNWQRARRKLPPEPIPPLA